MNLYYYLLVDRTDEESAGACYMPMGTSRESARVKVSAMLERYRRQGFVIAHFDMRPHYWQAMRKDGVHLELMMIVRATPLSIHGRPDDAPAIH